MIYGYARVSSTGQQLYGNGLEAQEEELTKHGAEVIYRETYTGTARHRPVLDGLLEELTDGDTLIITKLDRIARNAQDGLSIVEELTNKNVNIYILNMGQFDTSPIGKMMRTMLFAFAEFERDMIVQRTQEGKAIARQNPAYREGRKPIEYDEALFKELNSYVLEGKISVVEAADTLGVSRAKWYRIAKNISCE